MKLLKKLLLVALLAVTMVTVSGAQAQAVWNPFEDVGCRQAQKSAVCNDSKSGGNPLSGPDGIILKAVNLVAFIGGLAAIIIIILASMRFITSGGSSEDIAGARRTLIYAFVGLVVLVLARGLVAFVINRI
jgi:hypothetical protein